MMFDKDNYSRQEGLPANITTTGPMIIFIGDVHLLDTPDKLELTEENLVKIAERIILRRWKR